MTNAKLAAALLYASIGWRVMPLHSPAINAGAIGCSCGRDDCPSPAKHPRTERGLKDATSDEATIRDWWRRWPGANVGVVTGADSGIVVLDVDAGSGGIESLAELQGEHGDIAETVEAVTGGGGLHLIFRHPGRAHKISNSAKRVGPGLDVRGDGGYIVAAPSGHMSGRAYGWNASPESLSPIAIPEWLLARMIEPVQPASAQDRPRSDSGQHWLGKALAKAGVGSRNETGLWLACQLRDSGMPESEATGYLRDYAARCPRSDEAYTEREALQSLASAYRTAARSPAASGRLPLPGRQNAPKPPASTDAASELEQQMQGIIDGRLYNVPFPWTRLTRLTAALLPGCVTVVCGDPGVGKTFFVLQCLREWHANSHAAAVFFVEKNRVFHTHRLLAQLEASGNFVDWEWIKGNGPAVLDAIERHKSYLRELGTLIHSAPAERVTLESMLAWVREQCAHGKRVIVIDPITAVAAGKERWVDDENFMMGAQKAATDAGASLILITHARKGNRPGAPSGHDMANGAAYWRFADTTLWLIRHRDPVDVNIKTQLGLKPMQLDTFCQIQKARNGRGRGLELGFNFGHDLLYAEQGVVEPH